MEAIPNAAIPYVVIFIVLAGLVVERIIKHRGEVRRRNFWESVDDEKTKS